MDRGRQGHLLRQTTGDRAYDAFVPNALPPVPDIDVLALAEQTERASVALGRLDGISSVLPSAETLLYFYVRKEAVLSSQIEGTQSSLSDLLLYESEQAPGVPLEDVKEVSSYVRALNHGVRRLAQFPLSIRLLQEIHEVLLSSGRGSDKAPGEFRKTQVWIGGDKPWSALFVPPPAPIVPGAMGALEKFLNDDPARTPPLLKAALAHAQFETIHPFLDGNGRVGRLLIALVLVAEGSLKKPLLYLSLFFKTHRSRYYDLLQGTRFKGDWEAWLAFFLDGVRSTADQAHATAVSALAMFDENRALVRARIKTSGSALRVQEALQRQPITSVTQLAGASELSFPTVLKALESLQALGLVEEVTGAKRARVFAYRPFLRLLDEGLI